MQSAKDSFGNRKGHAFITFESEEDLLDSLQNALHSIGDSLVIVSRTTTLPGSRGENLQANQVLKDHGNEEKAARQDSLETQSQHGGSKRLYVGGLPSDVGVELLRAHFSTWGEVSDVYIPRLHRGGRANYCFVTFSSEEAAELSSKESPLKIDGKDIKALRLAGARPKYHKKN